MKPPSAMFSRRTMFRATAGLLATTLAAGSRAAEPASAKARKVVVTGGHPGDPEYGCGGTVALLTAAGHQVTLLYLNEGEPPGAKTPLPKGTRTAEARKACGILRAHPVFAGQIDGEAVVDRSRSEQFRSLLAAEQPELVLTHWPLDHHADHRAMFMLVYGAWLALKKSFALYFYEVSDGEDTVQFTPGTYVNITGTEQAKREACYAHATQNPAKFYALQDAVARWRGLECGVPRAEAFLRHVQSREFKFPEPEP